jgi:hypothetical protein
VILVKGDGERGIGWENQLGVSFSPVSDCGIDASAEVGQKHSLYAGNVDWRRRSSLIHGHGGTIARLLCFTKRLKRLKKIVLGLGATD